MILLILNFSLAFTNCKSNWIENNEAKEKLNKKEYQIKEITKKDYLKIMEENKTILKSANFKILNN